MTWWYLSFADDDGFLGGVYVEAESFLEAVTQADVHGANPGGEVLGAGPLPCGPSPERAHRLLRTKAEVDLAADELVARAGEA